MVWCAVVVGQLLFQMAHVASYNTPTRRPLKTTSQLPYDRPSRFLHQSCGMIEIICNDRLGKKVSVKCNEDDTIGDLKKLLAYVTGTRAEKIRVQKSYTVYKDHITLEDYEIHDGMNLELYYN